ncbi:MAG: DUF262 domain-containing protein [Candidatus Obscuribacter sp.]|nr:DUF262 domain-containing protein [Candidatus Obscuribacter sp.]
MQDIAKTESEITDVCRLESFCKENLLARLVCGYIGKRERRRPVLIARLELEIIAELRRKNVRPPRHADFVRVLKGIEEQATVVPGAFGRYIEGRHGHKSRYEFTDELMKFGRSIVQALVSFSPESIHELADEEVFEISEAESIDVESVDSEALVDSGQPYPELESETNESVVQPVDDRPITSQPNDWNVETLRSKYDRGTIELQPHYQREFVWELRPELPSRLIESILLEIPIPPIYFGKMANGKLELIDGQQRLTTLIKFVKNEFPLYRLERCSSLNGKWFRDLPEEVQTKILDTSIRSVVIDTGANDSLRYEIFERFNRGSVALNQQELRNCVYRGKFNDMLATLVNDSVWRKVKGTEKPEPRFVEREMILRLFALHSRLDNFAGNLKQFLNEYMYKHAPKDDDEIQVQLDLFRQAMLNVYAVFSTNSGRLYGLTEVGGDALSGGWNPKFSISALDIQASALYGQSRERVQLAADQIREAYIFLLLTDDSIRAAISGHTASTRATRLRWTAFRGQVSAILDSTTVEPRFFSYEFRKALYDLDPSCKLCHNPIYQLDEAAVDHIIPYAKSGRTVPENAQLAHRWCNSKKCKGESPVFIV